MGEGEVRATLAALDARASFIRRRLRCGVWWWCGGWFG